MPDGRTAQQSKGPSLIPFLVLAALLGFAVTPLLTRAIERLPAEEEPEEIAGLDPERSELPTLWYDRVPLLNIFIDLVRWSDFGRLSPASACPACKARLSWRDQLPLVAFIRLRGRCARCSYPIPARHLLTEVLTPLFFVLFAWHLGPGLRALEAMLISALFIVASIVDWRYQIIPDEVNLLGLFVGLLLAILRSTVTFVAVLGRKAAITPELLRAQLLEAPGSIGWAMAGVLAGAGSLWLFYHVGTWLAKTDAMGGGDIKLAAFAGAFLGPSGILLALLLSAFLGSFFGVLVMTLGNARKEGGFTKFAFGPYICMGVLLVLWFDTGAICSFLLESTRSLYGLDRYS